MQTLMQDGDFILLKQYGLYYIRHHVNNIVCQLTITNEERENLLLGKTTMSDIVKDYSENKLYDIANMRRAHVKAYIKISTGYEDDLLDNILDKLQQYPDIFLEFYQYVLDEKMPISDKNVSVKHFTAQDLCEHYLLTPLGAYNYLIYLRECPKDAIKDLKKLVRK